MGADPPPRRRPSVGAARSYGRSSVADPDADRRRASRRTPARPFRARVSSPRTERCRSRPGGPRPQRAPRARRRHPRRARRLRLQPRLLRRVLSRSRRLQVRNRPYPLTGRRAGFAPEPADPRVTTRPRAGTTEIPTSRSAARGRRHPHRGPRALAPRRPVRPLDRLLVRSGRPAQTVATPRPTFACPARRSQWAPVAALGGSWNGTAARNAAVPCFARGGGGAGPDIPPATTRRTASTTGRSDGSRTSVTPTAIP